jgi:hypothetical protein
MRAAWNPNQPEITDRIVQHDPVSLERLGPLPAIRSLAVVVGVLYGISASHLLETRILGGIILLQKLSLEFVRNRLAYRRQMAEIEQLT